MNRVQEEANLSFTVFSFRIFEKGSSNVGVFFKTVAETYCLYKAMDMDNANMNTNFTGFAIQHGPWSQPLSGL